MELFKSTDGRSNTHGSGHVIGMEVVKKYLRRIYSRLESTAVSEDTRDSRRPLYQRSQSQVKKTSLHAPHIICKMVDAAATLLQRHVEGDSIRCRSNIRCKLVFDVCIVFGASLVFVASLIFGVVVLLGLPSHRDCRSIHRIRSLRSFSLHSLLWPQ